jgi:hypothetical protein
MAGRTPAHSPPSVSGLVMVPSRDQSTEGAAPHCHRGLAAHTRPSTARCGPRLCLSVSCRCPTEQCSRVLTACQRGRPSRAGAVGYRHSARARSSSSSLEGSRSSGAFRDLLSVICLWRRRCWVLAPRIGRD